MAQQHSLDSKTFSKLQAPLRLDRLCDELNRTAKLKLDQVSEAVAALAPRPGALVYIQTRRLAIRINGFDPVVFSAVDASTLLQIAQVYLTATTAAAVSFIEFASQCFPFRITTITTLDEKPFVCEDDVEPHRSFTAIIGQSGLTHTKVSTPLHDTLFHLASKLTFGGISEGFIAGADEGEVQRELSHFLFFHNNYRSVPWLGGRTPIQKLVCFEGFRKMDVFDPYTASMNKSRKA